MRRHHHRLDEGYLKVWYAMYATKIERWLGGNPPPKGWDGDPIEWAWLEMPDPSTIWGRFLLWLGL